jgi:Major Facilitator Superfamily
MSEPTHELLQQMVTPTPTKVPSSSYWSLVKEHPNYRWFLFSFIITELGEWLTYVASLSMLQNAAAQSTLSAHDETADIRDIHSSSAVSGQFLISMLVVCRLIPSTMFSFLGGILADTCDRKRVMMILDICGGCIAICYWFMATANLDNERHSTTKIIILYICTIAQSTISGMYQPSRSSIVPLLMGDDLSKIEKANEISSIVWSFSAAVGSSLGGFIVDNAGVAFCFATDVILYFFSAVILAVFVKGNFNVVTAQQHANTKSVSSSSNKEDGIMNDESHRHSHPKSQQQERHNEIFGIRRLIREVRIYILTNDSSPYLLIKGCGALLFGASDVINVTFSQNEDGVLDPQRLGYMFSAIGIGCLIGPIVMPPQRCYLTTCIVSFYTIGLGYACMGWSEKFWFKCFWTGLRAAGTAVLWVDSSILLQTTTPATLLGRITSIDYAFALLAEALSALFAGVGQDHGVSAANITFILAGLGFFWGVVWTIATLYSRSQRRQENRISRKNDVLSIELEPLQIY